MWCWLVLLWLLRGVFMCWLQCVLIGVIVVNAGVESIVSQGVAWCMLATDKASLRCFGKKYCRQSSNDDNYTSDAKIITNRSNPSCAKPMWLSLRYKTQLITNPPNENKTQQLLHQSDWQWGVRDAWERSNKLSIEICKIQLTLLMMIQPTTFGSYDRCSNQLSYRNSNCNVGCMALWCRVMLLSLLKVVFMCWL